MATHSRSMPKILASFFGGIIWANFAPNGAVLMVAGIMIAKARIFM